MNHLNDLIPINHLIIVPGLESMVQPPTTCGTVDPMRLRPAVVAIVAVIGIISMMAACEASHSAEEEQVVRDTLAALTGSSAQLRLYDGLLGPVNLGGISLALAPQRVIEQVQTGLDEALADRACLTIATDDKSYLDLRFVDCVYKGVYVDGHLRIELVTETGECAGEPCVIATRYTTKLTELAIGDTQVRSASSVLRLPDLDSEPRTYFAQIELTDADGRTSQLRHELTWLRDMGCVTAELGAELKIDGRDISVGARAVEVCGDECPRAGRVQIAWGTGRVLAWEYHGEPAIAVYGPGGHEFVVDDVCDAVDP